MPRSRSSAPRPATPRSATRRRRTARRWRRTPPPAGTIPPPCRRGDRIMMAHALLAALLVLVLGASGCSNDATGPGAAQERAAVGERPLAPSSSLPSADGVAEPPGDVE